jgi:hypothetical protein
VGLCLIRHQLLCHLRGGQVDLLVVPPQLALAGVHLLVLDDLLDRVRQLAFHAVAELPLWKVDCVLPAAPALPQKGVPLLFPLGLPAAMFRPDSACQLAVNGDMVLPTVGDHRRRAVLPAINDMAGGFRIAHEWHPVGLVLL